jgi:hypothetical protein
VESTVYISPHIIARRDEDADEEHVMTAPSENALIVFRSAREVEKFRLRRGPGLLLPSFPSGDLAWSPAIGCATLPYLLLFRLSHNRVFWIPASAERTTP